MSSAGDPVRALDELEIGVGAVEVEPQQQRQQEHDAARSTAPRSARCARRSASSPRIQHDEGDAHQRQEGDERQERRNIGHRRSHHQPLHEHVPGDQDDDADQHGEGVVIDVAGLQPARLRARRRCVALAMPSGPNPSMILPSPLFHSPRRAASPAAHEQPVVQLVEIPLVEQEAGTAPRHRAGQPRRDVGLERCRTDRRARCRATPTISGSSFDPERHVVRVPAATSLRSATQDRVAPELAMCSPDEGVVAEPAGEDRADRQHDQRHQHDPRALVHVVHTSRRSARGLPWKVMNSRRQE